MQLELILEGFQWDRWPTVTGRADLRCQGKPEPYFVRPDVARDFLSLDADDPEALKAFLNEFGPLTRSQRAAGSVTQGEILEAQDWIRNKRGAAIVPDGPAFRPHSLRDYIYLSLEASPSQAARVCEYPGCEARLERKDPRRRFCDDHQKAGKKWRHELTVKAFKSYFGDNWQEEDTERRRLGRSHLEHMNAAITDLFDVIPETRGTDDNGQT